MISKKFNNLPVKIEKHESKSSYYIVDKDGLLICNVLDESEAKAVALAINCHDDMYALLYNINKFFNKLS